MTKDEIMKLEAGRELDALVARQIMGWSKWNIISDTGNFLGWFTKIELGQLGKGWYMADDNWSPSTDIAAAWQVVEWFMERGDIFLEYWSDREWFVSNKPDVVRRDVDTIIARCDGKSTGKPSLPLAICRAALLAVMDNRP